MSIITTDQHSHTTRSDWIITREQRIQQIVSYVETHKRKVLAVCTDHDIAIWIGDAEYLWLDHEDFYSCIWAEVTTYSQEIDLHAHLWFYTKSVSDKTHKVLKWIRNRKKANYMRNIEVLRENGFEIDLGDFLKKQEQCKWSKRNINSFQLAKYVLENPKNRALADTFFESEYHQKFSFWETQKSSVRFLKSFLRNDGKCKKYGRSKSLKRVWICPSHLSELAKNDSWLISLVHPHVTFPDIETFLEMFPVYYHEYWVRAIEYPTSAGLKWKQAIDSVMKNPEYPDLTATFGSDSHGYPAGGNYWDFLTMNPFVDDTFIDYHSRQFIERFQ